jgi:hypothetical protein
MAQDKQQRDESAPRAGAEVTQTPEQSPVGIAARQVKPAADRDEQDLKQDLVVPGDADRGALDEPQHEADQSPYPTQKVPPLERPPFATARPDVPIVSGGVKGANAHTPPDPEKFSADGRPRDLQ